MPQVRAPILDANLGHPAPGYGAFALIQSTRASSARVTRGYDADVKQHRYPSPIFLDSLRFVCYLVKQLNSFMK